MVIKVQTNVQDFRDIAQPSLFDLFAVVTLVHEQSWCPRRNASEMPKRWLSVYAPRARMM
jgi:hypothetical protein